MQVLTEVPRVADDRDTVRDLHVVVGFGDGDRLGIGGLDLQQRQVGFLRGGDQSGPERLLAARKLHVDQVIFRLGAMGSGKFVPVVKSRAPRLSEMPGGEHQPRSDQHARTLDAAAKDGLTLGAEQLLLVVCILIVYLGEVDPVYAADVDHAWANTRFDRGPNILGCLVGCRRGLSPDLAYLLAQHLTFLVELLAVPPAGGADAHRGEEDDKQEPERHPMPVLRRELASWSETMLRSSWRARSISRSMVVRPIDSLTGCGGASVAGAAVVPATPAGGAAVAAGRAVAGSASISSCSSGPSLPRRM